MSLLAFYALQNITFVILTTVPEEGKEMKAKKISEILSHRSVKTSLRSTGWQVDIATQYCNISVYSDHAEQARNSYGYATPLTQPSKRHNICI